MATANTVTYRKPEITLYGLQAGTDRTYFAKWEWTKKSNNQPIEHTDHFKCVWYYIAGGVSFVGQTEDVSASEAKQSLYNAPDNATEVQFKVLPVSTTRKVDNKDVHYWTSAYSTLLKIKISQNQLPQEPPTPSVSLDGYTLSASVNNVGNLHATYIQFHVVKGTKDYKYIRVKIENGAASCSLTVPANSEYRVRTRSYTGAVGKETFSSWSDYSNEVVTPAAPSPQTPPVPTVTMNGYVLSASVNNVGNLNATHIQFHIVKGTTNPTDYKYIRVKIASGMAACSYTVPANSQFRVRARSYTGATGHETFSQWSDYCSTINSPAALTPITPPTPTVTMDGYTLRATVNNVGNLNADYIQFHIVKGTTDYKYIRCKIASGMASCSYTVAASGEYRVRARSYTGAVKKETFSDWSQYTNPYYSPPGKIGGYYKYKATGASSIYVEWASVTGADRYDVEYTDTKEYFDSNPSGVQKTTVQDVHHAEITNLETGKRWYFRVRAGNSTGYSGWGPALSLLLGSPPDAPTVWSFKSYVYPSQVTRIYWTHNTVDGSDQTAAQINVKPATGDPLDEYTATLSSDRQYYDIPNSDYTDGTKVQWRVRTKGILSAISNPDYGYGAWSPYSEYTVIEPSTVSISGDLDITAYPAQITCACEPLSHVLGYTVSITADGNYDTLDEYGNEQHVRLGEEVYHEYFPCKGAEKTFDVPFLENNEDYTITVTASTIYGEAVEESEGLSIAVEGDEYDIEAEVLVDAENLTASIHPYCMDDDENLVNNLKMAVYRREYDGRLVLIEDDIDNEVEEFIVDPHPSLDFARYRIVARSEETGIINFSDVPPVPVGENHMIIQWNEKWVPFDANAEDEMEDPNWSGSMIRIEYDMSISEEYTKESELIKYSGRVDPVSYYGTNMDTKSTWSAAIITLDPDLLYQLRRLANYPGDVYVREPSGIGYWAHVNVDISKDEIAPVARVSLDITKVAGGA